jgi:hypothetical protein
MSENSAETMSVSGTIEEVFDTPEEAGIATFKVCTKLGHAYVWVWEEIDITFRVGARFSVKDAPIVFDNGYPVAVVRPGVHFKLDQWCYKIDGPLL